MFSLLIIVVMFWNLDNGRSILSNCVFKIYSKSTPHVNQKAVAENTSKVVIGELYDAKKDTILPPKI
jgi:hypothetical protein